MVQSANTEFLKMETHQVLNKYIEQICKYALLKPVVFIALPLIHNQN